MTQIILRRSSDSKAIRPFYQIAIDIIYIVKRGKEWECWNGDQYGVMGSQVLDYVGSL